MRQLFAAVFTLTFLLALSARADDIGCVSTDVRMLGLANDKVCVASFNDPKVPGVACYISRAQTGGVKGAIGVAEDPSEFSISCRQVGSITLDPNLKDGEKVFEESRSFWFKTLQVVRFLDKKNNALVYLSYSDKLIEGSPANSVAAIPIMPWPAK
jgi:CreA protein